MCTYGLCCLSSVYSLSPPCAVARPGPLVGRLVGSASPWRREPAISTLEAALVFVTPYLAHKSTRLRQEWWWWWCWVLGWIGVGEKVEAGDGGGGCWWWWRW